jgi:hypothetical protein
VVGDLAAGVALAVVVVRAEILIAHAGVSQQLGGLQLGVLGGDARFGGAASSHSHIVNTPRTSSAREMNRASQPRTVEAGQPSPAAIFRWPVPAALAVRPAQITAASSARRSRQLTGSSTCVTPQPRHRDRRGRSRQPIPP